MSKEILFCAAVGFKRSQILEHFRHLFVYVSCSQCHELIGIDTEVIKQVCSICLTHNYCPMTLCTDCHASQKPHKQINISNPELEQKIDHIVAERN